MRVALWGSYAEGNFGDDLMALLLARACSDVGASVVAYRTPTILTSQYGIERAESLDHLLEGADLCVVGGGEFLFKNAPIKQFARKYLRDFERSCSDLATHLNRLSVPLAAISIGGDGTTEFGRLSSHRRQLFGSRLLRYASVRLRSDTSTLARTGADVEYYPDVLLATPDLVPGISKQPGTTRPVQIGINLHRDIGVDFVRALEARLRGEGGVDITVIRSHHPGSGHDYELDAADVEGAKDHHQYTDPIETARFLSSLDVIVSSKLHVGVVAMSYGATFISLGGKPKAQRFMSSVGSDQVYASHQVNAAAEAVAALIAQTRAAERDAGYSVVNDLRSAAMGHLRALRKLVAG